MTATKTVKNIQPLGDRVVIRRSEMKTTRGGILLPETAQEKPKQGEVIAVGPGKLDDAGHLKPMHVEVGDLVLFSTYAGTEVKTDDAEGEYLILSQEDILGILVQ